MKRTLTLLLFLLPCLTFAQSMAAHHAAAAGIPYATATEETWDITVKTLTPNYPYVFSVFATTSVNLKIQWGDGATTTSTSTGNQSHTYAAAGTYIMKLSGALTGVSCYFTFGLYTAGNTRSRPIAVGKVQGITGITDFFGCFQGCNLLTGSLPVDMFRNYPNVTGFASTFSGTRITGIPADFFRYNAEVLSFNNTFSSSILLATLPDDLFRYNTKVTSYYYTFDHCDKLQMNPNIFGPNLQTHFAGRTVDFTNFAYTWDTWTGTQGTAPALWTVTGWTPTPDYAFGNDFGDGRVLSNYSSIPSAWKD